LRRIFGRRNPAPGHRYVVGAGCEVPRGTPEANFMAMRKYAAEATL